MSGLDVGRSGMMAMVSMTTRTEQLSCGHLDRSHLVVGTSEHQTWPGWTLFGLLLYFVQSLGFRVSALGNGELQQQRLAV